MTVLKKFWPETFVFAKKRSPFYRRLFYGMKSAPFIKQLPAIENKVLVRGKVSISTLWELLQMRAKITAQIHHALCEEIEALQLPPQKRKHRTFVDLR